MKSRSLMQIEKEVMETVAEALNSNYFTITEIAKEMGYKSPTYVTEKAKKLKLGIKIKTLYLLSPEERTVLKEKIIRQDKEGFYEK